MTEITPTQRPKLRNSTHTLSHICFVIATMQLKDWSGSGGRALAESMVTCAFLNCSVGSSALSAPRVFVAPWFDALMIQLSYTWSHCIAPVIRRV